MVVETASGTEDPNSKNPPRIHWSELIHFSSIFFCLIMIFFVYSKSYHPIPWRYSIARPIISQMETIPRRQGFLCRAYVHTYLHMYIHTYICTYIPTYVHTCLHMYIHAYICTYMPTYVHTYLHMYIHTYICTYIPTYVHTYLHMYIHTYICTCIHAVEKNTRWSLLDLILYEKNRTLFNKLFSGESGKRKTNYVHMYKHIYI
jgi:hypothetical protein